MSTLDSRTLNYLVRMVIPMRREFGRSLDVSHFMHDTSYAREVLDHARQSVDPRLRDYAACVEKGLRGARAEAPASHRDEPVRMPADASEAPPVADVGQEAQALKARIANKYIFGVR